MDRLYPNLGKTQGGRSVGLVHLPVIISGGCQIRKGTKRPGKREEHSDAPARPRVFEKRGALAFDIFEIEKVADVGARAPAKIHAAQAESVNGIARRTADRNPVGARFERIGAVANVARRFLFRS